MLKAKMPWDTAIDLIERGGEEVEIDREEEMFICPYCDEPIYKEDYPEIEGEIYPEEHNRFSPFCPVCGTFLELE